METVEKQVLSKIWQDCLMKLKEVFGSTVFETWIAPLVLQEEPSQQAQAIILEAPNHFFKDWVLRNYLARIQDILQQRLNSEGVALELKIVAKDESGAQEPKVKKPLSSWDRYHRRHFSMMKIHRFSYLFSDPLP